MKKVILSIILILFAFPVFSEKDNPSESQKFPKGKGAILLDDLKEGKVYGSLEKMAGKRKAKTMRLIGHSSFDSPQDKLLVGNKFVLIGWLGVQKIEEPSKVVMFKEPIVSSFIVKNDSDANGISLPTFGEMAYLEAAIQDLEEGKINPDDFKKQRVIKVPSGKGSEIILPVKRSSKKDKHLQLKANTIGDTEKNSNDEFKPDLAEGSDLSYSQSSKESTQNQSSSYNQTRGSFNPNFGAMDNNHALGGLQNPGIGNHARERLNNHVENHLAPRFAENKNFDLYLLPTVDENNLPIIQGNALVLVKKENGKQEAYFVRNGIFAKNNEGKLIHKEVGLNVEGFLASPNGKVEKNPENKDRIERIIDDVLFDYKNAEEGQREPIDFGPEVTFEVTEEGCLPEHDALQEKITIMTRAKKFEDGQLVDEGICEKTREIYTVKRDYLCEGCQDEVNTVEKKAYARYMEHWFDKEQQRHNLGIKLDKGSPFEFFDDTQGCGFNTESEEGFAIKMSRLAYLNKFRTLKVVEDCRVIEGAQKIPVQETTRGCELIHDFENKNSHEQKRSFFTINGVEHQVHECNSVEPALRHEFVAMGCQPALDLVGRKITNTARRRIRTSTGLKFITDDCEPVDHTQLQVTRQGCENEYFHDNVSGKSYLKKRYFILGDHDLISYVTGCLRTDDFVKQKTEHNGEWEHDDQNKISRPKLLLYIDGEQGRISIESPRVRGQIGQLNYTLIRSDNRPTENFYFEGCFRRTRTQKVDIYKRGDDSIYEQAVREGNIIVSAVNECTRTYKKVWGVVGSGRKGRDVHGWIVSIFRIYPNGTQELELSDSRQDLESFANFSNAFVNHY